MFLEMGLHRFPQKCVSDQREEMHFCRPNFDLTDELKKAPGIIPIASKQILQIYVTNPV
jgi:hypothetical protein